MAVIKSEFFLALNQVATERGITPEMVVESIKAAVLAAYKKDYGDTRSEEELEQATVKLDTDSGEMHIMLDGVDITPPGFGRIAAQTARQVILQQIREAEKKTIIGQYSSQVGTILRGRVIRFDDRSVRLDIGKAEGVLPKQEQIRTENYRLNDVYLVYLKEITEDQFGNSHIVVSRSDPALVSELFKKEVPEVVSGTVKIHAVVREPGDRTKIAVYSETQGVDPVGACVGQKGIRVKAVTDELGGDEKIDIIQYSSDLITFIREALSPAKVDSVELDRDKTRAAVKVTTDQAPLAIGKGGVNVNLASRLTGVELDIVQVESVKSVEPSFAEASAGKSVEPDKTDKSDQTETPDKPVDSVKSDKSEQTKKEAVEEKVADKEQSEASSEPTTDEKTAEPSQNSG